MTLLTTDQAAERLGLSPSAVQQMIYRGQIAQTERGKYNVHLLDSEVVNTLRHRRMVKLADKIRAMGYIVDVTDAQAVTE